MIGMYLNCREKKLKELGTKEYNIVSFKYELFKIKIYFTYLLDIMKYFLNIRINFKSIVISQIIVNFIINAKIIMLINMHITLLELNRIYFMFIICEQLHHFTCDVFTHYGNVHYVIGTL